MSEQGLETRSEPASAGLTLLELLVSISLFVVLSGVVTSLTIGTMRTNALASAYAGDVLGARRALEAIERDLRAARRVDIPQAGAGADALLVGRIAWRVREGTLEREAPEGVSPVARGVARIEASREGAIVRVVLALAARARGARTPPRIATTVALRTEEARQ